MPRIQEFKGMSTVSSKTLQCDLNGMTNLQVIFKLPEAIENYRLFAEVVPLLTILRPIFVHSAWENSASIFHLKIRPGSLHLSFLLKSLYFCELEMPMLNFGTP